ncbi:MAG: prepilin-type N-terminal cleavage/methylation domain-containing protein [Deltaproteobacteria bacterium]|nr:prepilin-type N-terminal cleavage/methylation domain-containing protein [Deltaproteobacteria bacterium]
MKLHSNIHPTSGFTLVEMMISIVIVGVLTGAIYETYENQQRAYLRQELRSDMHQNARTGLYFLKKDIRMAGYDPTEDAQASILVAAIADLEFEVDADGSGVIGDGSREWVQYALTEDNNGDGMADSFPCRLGRAYKSNAGSSGLQPVADYAEALEFCYILDDGTATTSADEPERIRSVYVSVLMRTAVTVKGHRNANVQYRPASCDLVLTPDWTTDGSSSRPQSHWGPFNDSFQRSFVISKIRCRNMGLNQQEAW